jgi:hypothetical protein
METIMAKQKGKTFGIIFGPLADPIRVQCKQQGYPLTAAPAKALQRQADAIVTLRLSGLITPAAADKARQKFITLLGKKLQQRDGAGRAAA